MVRDPELPPNPADTGASGTQEASSESSSIEVIPPPFSNQTIDTIMGLAASRPKSFGGEAMASMVSAICYQTSADLQSARKELKRSEEELTDSKVRIAVLEERIAGFIREDLPKKATITLGTLMASLGFSNVSNIGLVGVAFGFIGLLLVIIGWFNGRKGDSQ